MRSNGRGVARRGRAGCERVGESNRRYWLQSQQLGQPSPHRLGAISLPLFPFSLLHLYCTLLIKATIIVHTWSDISPSHQNEKRFLLIIPDAIGIVLYCESVSLLLWPQVYPTLAFAMHFELPLPEYHCIHDHFMNSTNTAVKLLTHITNWINNHCTNSTST